MRKLPLRLLQLVTILSAGAIFATLLTDFSSLARRQRSEAPQDNVSVKMATELVSVRVTVTDQRGRAIEGLSKDDFKVYEDKVEQPVSFFSDEDTPASIGIVFDTSSSMSGGKIIRAKEALARFIQTSHEQDEYFLISFDSSAQLLLDGARDGQAVLDRFNYLYPKGETALYDAVYLGIEKVSQGTYPKRAIILISDGEDNHSRRSFDELRRKLQEFDGAIYTIGIAGNSHAAKSSVPDNGPFLMDRLASISGGKSFWPVSAEKMNEAFERIALELRRQYSIGYLPSNFVADGKWRRIKVAVTDAHKFSRLVVRSREGYYAVKNPEDHRDKLGTRH
jgi:Ca-activated chloride channel homolog